jgi:hypothetical protein
LVPLLVWFPEKSGVLSPYSKISAVQKVEAERPWEKRTYHKQEKTAALFLQVRKESSLSGSL